MLAERAHNIRTLGWRMWLRCEVRNIALRFQLTSNQMVLPGLGSATGGGRCGREIGLAGGGGESDSAVSAHPH
jgi:hypothetical protein